MSSQLELKLGDRPFVAGGRVSGTVTLHEPGRFRDVEVCVNLREECSGRTVNALSFRSGPLHSGPLDAGSSHAFEVPVPEGVPASVTGKHGKLVWEVDARAEQFGRDVHARERIYIWPEPTSLGHVIEAPITGFRLLETTIGRFQSVGAVEAFGAGYLDEYRSGRRRSVVVSLAVQRRGSAEDATEELDTLVRGFQEMGRTVIRTIAVTNTGGSRGEQSIGRGFLLAGAARHTIAWTNDNVCLIAVGREESLDAFFEACPY